MNTSALPNDLPDFGLIADLIHQHALHQPEHLALVEVERQCSHGALDALMDCLVSALQRDGVRPGEAIAMCAASSVDYAAVFLGALRAGVVVAPLAPRPWARPNTTAGTATRIALDGSGVGLALQAWHAGWPVACTGCPGA
jgi:acyl-CoA synthetase (AMP-forming)/AMP-acid ligase II